MKQSFLNKHSRKLYNATCISVSVSLIISFLINHEGLLIFNLFLAFFLLLIGDDSNGGNSNDSPAT